MTHSYRPKPRIGVELRLVLLSFSLAAILGALAGLGSILYAIPVAGLVAIVVLLRVPIPWQVYALCATCFAISGPLIYFMKIDAARWLPLLLAIGLYVPLVAALFRFDVVNRPRVWPAFMAIFALFLISITLGSLYQSPRLSEVISAARSYFGYWSVLLVIGLGLVSLKCILGLWKFLMGMALLQLPVTVYQHFFVSKASLKVAAWDAVVGTFPGSPEGGGASAGMGIFVLIMVVWALAMWRRKMIAGCWVGIIVLSTVTTVALAEIKAVVVLIPVAVALVFYKEVLKHPLQSVAVTIAGLVMVVGLLAGYQALYYDRGYTLAKNSSDSPIESIQNQLNPSRVLETENGMIQMSRAALMADWWSRNVEKGDLEHALMGYGVGATSSSRLGPGELAGRYPYAIDMTSTTILLWETGLAGHLLLALGLLMAAYSAARSSKDPRVPVVHQATLQAVSIALVLLTATLAYKNFILRTAPSQFLLAFLLGQVLYWARELAAPVRFRANRGGGRKPSPDASQDRLPPRVRLVRR